MRPVAALVAALATLMALFGSGENQFTAVGVVAWVVAVAAWFVALWEGAPVSARAALARWRAALSDDALRFSVPWTFAALALILAAGAVFLFRQLATVPPEMTSDHVEKLLDVNDVLHGARKVFFPRNTGRESLQFYFAALLARLRGGEPDFLTLKLTGAIAGWLLIPGVYFLGAELENRLTGLFAAALVAVGFWPVTIARVGLRFPLNPLFVAPALFFIFRGLRRNSRNDFLWAGLLLGAGLYGYSPFRVMAVALALIFLAYLLFPRVRGGRVRLVGHFAALSFVALATFAPLLRYQLDNPNMFWYRALRTATDVETELRGPPVEIFIENLRNGLGMFNFVGDTVWVNTIPGLPLLGKVVGGLFVIGVALLLYRLARRPGLRDALLLALIPILILPSTLSLAYPQENPSAVRAGAVIPIVYLIAALTLARMIQHYRSRFRAGRLRHIGTVAALGIVVLAARSNYSLYFEDYPAQYVLQAQNASEVGAVIERFAKSVGSYDTAFVRAFPHWVDTRAVGMYAGRFGWDQVYLDNESLAIPVADSRPKLFIVHPDDVEAQQVLLETYPTGAFSRYESSRPNRDFFTFLAPSSPSVVLPGEG